MRINKTLNEELGRMKNLMSYQNGNYKNPIVEQDNTKEPTQPICAQPISHLGSFPVNVTTGSGAFQGFLKAVKDKINSDPKLKELSDRGAGLFVTKFQIKGGASNYYGGSVEPDVANDRKSKPAAGTYTHKKNSTNYKKNLELAVNRAKNVANKLNEKGGLETLKVKFNDGVLQNAISNATGSVIDTGGKNDNKRDKSKYKNTGQIVQISMEICYVPKKQQTDKDVTGTTKTIETGTTKTIETGTTTTVETGTTKQQEIIIKETVKTCFDESTIEVIYDGSGHSCNHAIYEIYANGYKLKRAGRDGKLYDYASLNNKGIMDNAEIINSSKPNMGRRNVFKLDIDGENKEFFNEDIVGKHDGELVITAACKKTSRKDGRFLGPWKRKGGFDCHEGVGTIKLDIPSINKRQEVEVQTPNKFDQVVKLHTFSACDMFKKHVTANDPTVMGKIKNWFRKRKRKKKG